ncbi:MULTISPECIES: fimbrillin family protein [unclassified Dysgonomonas]|uniref:fimbrillin family protein n=1 Tax=unclassified Dysgonomonas TaxID=2630389 RepID=UPI00068341D4|nr:MULTISPECIES: fimbrillin family protein [unclassified Dysgonomonas]MBD8348162.1 fimbrillin family protein [Dysgonomonas sp. HGC4]MBF0575861.1 fimbrillin family protein [Dysgonomonas sp. GY617]
MTKKLYILLITSICLIFTSCLSDSECGNNDTLRVSIVADIASSKLKTRSSKSGFSENDNIGLYMVDYVNGIPMPVGTISNFMNTEYVYDGTYWNSKDTEELYLTTDQTKADIYAYYPFDYEMSRTPGKADLRSYPFSVESDQSLSSQKSDFLWAKYSELSSANTIAKLTFKHILSKIVLNVTYGNLGNGNESVTIHNLTQNALINMRTADVSEVKLNSNNEIKPYLQDIANAGFDKTFSAIIIPQSVETGTSLFAITLNDQMFAFTLDSPISFESGLSYTFNLVIGEANTRSIQNTNIERKISLVDKSSF